jgi:hypothetical protein
MANSAESPDDVELPYRRHAFGWPAGSVRALLALGVLGLLWALVLRYAYVQASEADKTLPRAFVYLQFLMVLILAHFFAAHGGSIGRRVSKRSPLGLPRGTIRLLLLVGYAGMAVVLYRTQPEVEFPSPKAFLLMIGLLIGGFFVGHILTGLMWVLSGGRVPYWYLSLQAWIALLSLLCMGVLLLIHVFINPSLTEDMKIDVNFVDAVLGALVGLYFGSRS